MTAAALGAAVLLAPFAGRALLRSWESNPVLRGHRLAAAHGCFACHRPYGGTEIPNSGSRWGTVPRFGGGNAFMYAASREGIEEFIRFGAPREWLAEESVRRRLASQAIRMPAYEARLGDAEVGDLVAYVAAAEGIDLPGDAAAQAGRKLAREQGCLSCHGVEGAGGVDNPGSLGGFVPGFAGDNFPHLVRDRDEFREWVLDGTSRRLARNPVVRWFWERQRIAMPAYRGSLDQEQVDALWAWVEAVRGEARAAPPPHS